MATATNGVFLVIWDKAVTLNSDEDITTNQNGVLSEYGEFFPTDPGLVALTTKTNAGAGLRPDHRSRHWTLYRSQSRRGD